MVYNVISVGSSAEYARACKEKGVAGVAVELVKGNSSNGGIPGPAAVVYQGTTPQGDILEGHQTIGSTDGHVIIDCSGEKAYDLGAVKTWAVGNAQRTFGTSLQRTTITVDSGLVGRLNESARDIETPSAEKFGEATRRINHLF